MQRRSMNKFVHSTGDMSRKKPSPEERSLLLKEQLFAEELVITDDFVESIVRDVGVPFEQTDVSDILEVTYVRYPKSLILLF